jgi:hypothetical protein
MNGGPRGRDTSRSPLFHTAISEPGAGYPSPRILSPNTRFRRAVIPCLIVPLILLSIGRCEEFYGVRICGLLLQVPSSDGPFDPSLWRVELKHIGSSPERVTSHEATVPSQRGQFCFIRRFLTAYLRENSTVFFRFNHIADPDRSSSWIPLEIEHRTPGWYEVMVVLVLNDRIAQVIMTNWRGRELSPGEKALCEFAFQPLLTREEMYRPNVCGREKRPHDTSSSETQPTRP